MRRTRAIQRVKVDSMATLNVLKIFVGEDSIILAEPKPGGMVEVGGRAEQVEQRDYGGVRR